MGTLIDSVSGHWPLSKSIVTPVVPVEARILTLMNSLQVLSETICIVKLLQVATIVFGTDRDVQEQMYLVVRIPTFPGFAESSIKRSRQTLSKSASVWMRNAQMKILNLSPLNFTFSEQSSCFCKARLNLVFVESISSTVVENCLLPKCRHC